MGRPILAVLAKTVVAPQTGIFSIPTVAKQQVARRAAIGIVLVAAPAGSAFASVEVAPKARTAAAWSAAVTAQA